PPNEYPAPRRATATENTPNASPAARTANRSTCAGSHPGADAGPSARSVMGQARRDPGTAAWWALHHQGAAERRDPVGQTAQPGTARRIRSASTVIRNGNGQPPVRGGDINLHL